MAVTTNQEEINLLRQSGRIAAVTLIAVGKIIRPGCTTMDLNQLADKLVRQSGAEPTFFNYDGYPASLCVSVNEEVVHGIPSERKLAEGDVVSLDLGVNYHGWFSDHAVTFPVGKITPIHKKLLEDTRQSLLLGIKAAKINGRVGDIGAAVESFLTPRKYGIVRQLCGHGVGRAVHESPQIPNVGRPGTGPMLVAGEILAIEPMITLSDGAVRTLTDGWTVVSDDGSTAAHFEHTVILTPNGAEIITKP